jgi:protein-S-isoprenylcysteine O-methyltransferase Ste14
MTSMNDRSLMGAAAVTIEGYFFPAVFLYYIYDKVHYFFSNAAAIQTAVPQLLSGDWSVPVQTTVLGAVNSVFVLLLDAAVIYGLLVRRNLKRGPQGFQEIFIPLLASFFYLAYNFENVPQELNNYFVPESLLAVSTFTGIVLNIAGSLISFTAVCSLRYSFGVFVQVRDIVKRGLYRYVRHPMYLGYILSFIGLLFIQPCLYYLILLLCSVIMTIYRASLEEKKLMALPEYQEYARKTPFMFPGF